MDRAITDLTEAEAVALASLINAMLATAGLPPIAEESLLDMIDDALDSPPESLDTLSDADGDGEAPLQLYEVATVLLDVTLCMATIETVLERWQAAAGPKRGQRAALPRDLRQELADGLTARLADRAVSARLRQGPLRRSMEALIATLRGSDAA